MPHALIIDDNRNNIDVLTMFLEREGVSQTAVQNARQVSKTLGQLDKVDVVFLDLEFPYGDGFQVLEAVKSLPDFADVPVIAYTVHTGEIDEVRRAGFDGFLGKPLDSRRFSGQLSRILKGIPVWDI